MNKSASKTKELTYIALSLASLIVGGSVVYQVSMVLPIPGIKYVFLAPFMSMVIYILLSILNQKLVLLKMGMVFGLIMSMMNLYMGLAILMTAVSSQVVLTLYSGQQRPFLGGVAFAFFTGTSALFISKYMIGGVFGSLSLIWILLVGLMCMVFGIAGSILGNNLMKYLFTAISRTDYK